MLDMLFLVYRSSVIVRQEFVGLPRLACGLLDFCCPQFDFAIGRIGTRISGSGGASGCDDRLVKIDGHGSSTHVN
jgi:hypothetical protein